MSKNIYVVRKLSKANTPYLNAYVDMGYRNLSITFDTALIAELTGLSFEYLNSIEIDKPILVGTYTKEGK